MQVCESLVSQSVGAGTHGGASARRGLMCILVVPAGGMYCSGYLMQISVAAAWVLLLYL